jgi:hypothetical protein
MLHLPRRAQRGHCTAGCGVREALLVHAPMSRERDEIAPE